MSFTIDSDIPVPSGNNGNRPELLAKLDELKINQSIFVPKDFIQINSAQSLASKANAKYAPKRFTSKTNDGATGVRIWRIQ